MYVRPSLTLSRSIPHPHRNSTTRGAHPNADSGSGVRRNVELGVLGEPVAL